MAFDNPKPGSYVAGSSLSKCHKRIPVVTLTFNESTPSAPGSPTRTKSEQALFTKVLNPLPSLPTTNTVRSPFSTRPNSDPESSAHAPRTFQPPSRNSPRSAGKSRVEYRGRRSNAPALAAETTGEGGLAFLEHTRTDTSRKKCADRRMAPKFCGSTTSSNASQNRQSGESSGEARRGMVRGVVRRTKPCEASGGDERAWRGTDLVGAVPAERIQISLVHGCHRDSLL